MTSLISVKDLPTSAQLSSNIKIDKITANQNVEITVKTKRGLLETIGMIVFLAIALIVSFGGSLMWDCSPWYSKEKFVVEWTRDENPTPEKLANLRRNQQQQSPAVFDVPVQGCPSTRRCSDSMSTGRFRLNSVDSSNNTIGGSSQSSSWSGSDWCSVDESMGRSPSFKTGSPLSQSLLQKVMEAYYYPADSVENTKAETPFQRRERALREEKDGYFSVYDDKKEAERQWNIEQRSKG